MYEAEYAKRRPQAPILNLLAEAELRDQREVTIAFGLAQIVEQRATLVDHHQQAAARVIVLRVSLEMLGQRLDAVGQDRDLNLGAAGVAFGAGMFLDQRILALGGNRHSFSFDIAD